MPLNWSVADVEDYETVCYVTREDGEKYLHSDTEELIWNLMGMGINRITEKNHKQVAMRLYMYRVIEPMTVRADVNLYAVVKAHIGLHTNVPNITDAKFKEKVFQRIKDRAQRFMEQDKQQLEPEEGEE